MKINTLLRTALSGAWLLSLLAGPATFAQQYQHPDSLIFVSDFASILPAETALQLNRDLTNFAATSGIEIALVTVPSLEGKDVATYAEGIGTAWGVGKKGANNGVIFLIAPTEHKMRIQTASGSRTLLSDEKAAQICQSFVVPRFKEGNLIAGIVDGTHAIIDALTPSPPVASALATSNSLENPSATVKHSSENESQTPQNNDSRNEDKFAVMTVLLLFGIVMAVVIICLFLVYFANQSASRKMLLSEASKFPSALTEAEQQLRHSDVREDTRKKVGDLIADIRKQFRPIQTLTERSEKIDWSSMYYSLTELQQRLRQANSLCVKDIAYAETARKRGPELMATLPTLIATAEQKRTEGKLTDRATERLASARQQYEEARRLHDDGGDTNPVNWVILYGLLSSADDHCLSAQRMVYAPRESVRISSSSAFDDTSSRSSDSFSSDTSSFNTSPSTTDSSSSSSSGSDFGGGGGFSSSDGGGGGGASW